MSQERTEQPTPRRLRKFREEGRVAKSQELSAILVLFVGFYLLGVQGARMAAGLAGILQGSYRALAFQRPGEFTFELLTQVGGEAGLRVGGVLLTWLAALILVGLAVNVAQTRGLVQPRLLIPRWERIHPIARIRQLFGIQMLVEGAKGVAKQAIVGAIIVLAFRDSLDRLMAAASAGLALGVQELSRMGFQMALRASAALLVIACLDYLWQYRRYRQSLMMTRQEVKEEMKHQEGAPELRARIRKVQREMAQQRMMAQVPKADAVVANPTHYAVAIRYDGATMEAPQIVAKGKDRVALRIIGLARRHGVPVVSNRPLARALYPLPLNTAIPPEFFQAVAEVLAFVYSLRGHPRGAHQRRGSP